MGGADGRKEDDARGVLQIEQAGGQGHIDAAVVLVHIDDELVHQRDVYKRQVPTMGVGYSERLMTSVSVLAGRSAVKPVAASMAVTPCLLYTSRCV